MLIEINLDSEGFGFSKVGNLNIHLIGANNGR